MIYLHGWPTALLLLGGLSRLFWLILLAVLVWVAIRWLTTHSGPSTPHAPTGTPINQLSAMEILRQRYARGEIDAATFDQMRERLEGSQGQSQPPHL